MWRKRKLVGQTPEIPQELRRFCVYDWIPVSQAPTPNQPPARRPGGSTTPGQVPPPPTLSTVPPERTIRPDFQALPDEAGMRLERDCRVIAPQAVPSAISAALLHRAYARQINRPQYPARATRLEGRQQVDIAIIDNAPDEIVTGLPVGSEGHGFAIATLARENSCYFVGDQAIDCGLIRSFNALGEAEGGYGYISDVTAAIDRAMDYKATTSRNMVINLSLGWDSVFAKPAPPGTRVAEKALIEALNWATCSGVLVVAAAGNRSSKQFSKGPTYPGGWEEMNRRCSSQEPYKPLLYAVGGVQGSDKTLAIATPKGSPRLVVPSAFVSPRIISSGSTVGGAEMLTGTSLAAAAVSGLAAHLWSHAPTASADKIMAKIYESGVPLSGTADFQASGPRYRRVRLDACAAADSMCSGSCPKCEPPRPAGTDASVDYAKVLSADLPTLMGSSAMYRAGPPTGLPTLPFPKPWAGPQPGETICPNCTVLQGILMGRLLVPDGFTVAAAVFRPSCPGGCPDLLLDSGITTGDDFKVDLNNEMNVQDIETAFMEVYLVGGGNVSVHVSEIYIGP